VVVSMALVVARQSVADRYTRLVRTTGILGITSLVLLFGPIIALASAGEPPLNATAAEAAKYFANLEVTWSRLVLATLTLGMIGTLWFFVAFGFVLRRAEGDPPWRSAVAILSGALLAAYGLIGSSTEAASLHGGRITLDVADYAFASGSVGFANAWIAIASFSLSSGWVILSTRVLERWMGWWLVATGVGLVVSRFVWTSDLWTLPYILFWLWVLVLSVRLLRRPSLPDLSQS
jgi:hypothetical protein